LQKSRSEEPNCELWLSLSSFLSGAAVIAVSFRADAMLGEADKDCQGKGRSPTRSRHSGRQAHGPKFGDLQHRLQV
jgi:hypothetical protein